MAQLLTTAEVAERLRVSVATVNKYARDKVLNAVELPGGHRRYRVEDVDSLLDFSRGEPEPTEAAS